jgi:hypothetical protein
VFEWLRVGQPTYPDYSAAFIQGTGSKLYTIGLLDDISVSEQ